MAKQVRRTYREVLANLRDQGFEITEAPATPNRVFIRKNNISAALEMDSDEGVKLFARPGFVIGGEIAKLVDKGYQKFLKTTKLEMPATADHLKMLHAYQEELREAVGGTSLYNESLGSVSDSYMYDRVTDRDAPEAKRPTRPWQRKRA